MSYKTPENALKSNQIYSVEAALVIHVANPECTSVIIGGQQYDVDNTP